MTPDEYEKINAFCRKNLVLALHDDHLEDVTQYVAMKHFESGGSRDWKGVLIDYLRMNGLSQNRSKKSSAVLSGALSLDKTSEGGSDSYYLLEKTILKVESIPNPLETFLKPLNFNCEVIEWIIQNTKVKTKSKYGRGIGVAM